MFARGPKRFAAGRKDPKTWAAANRPRRRVAASRMTCSQLSRISRSALVLEIRKQCVEQWTIGHFLHAQRRCDRCGDQRRITDRRESDEADRTVGGIAQRRRDVQRRLGLADRRRRRECDHPMSRTSAAISSSSVSRPTKLVSASGRLAIAPSAQGPL